MTDTSRLAAACLALETCLDDLAGAAYLADDKALTHAALWLWDAEWRAIVALASVRARNYEHGYDRRLRCRR